MKDYHPIEALFSRGKRKNLMPFTDDYFLISIVSFGVHSPSKKKFYKTLVIKFECAYICFLVIVQHFINLNRIYDSFQI